MEYRTLRQLPSGGFSDIFEVEDPETALHETLVLKRLSAEMSARPAVRTAFADEARILRELRHPNVVTFRRCYFDSSGRVCLVMEKVEGEQLASWAHRHRDRPRVVLEAFGRVIEAVDYLHHRPQPFLHLDLKPENILVRSTACGPVPVLIDFGIARSLGGGGLKAYTPPYAAPEQQSGSTLGCFTDVHALGQILVELLDELGEGIDPALRDRLRAVADKATRTSRHRRYPDAGALMLGLRAARATETAPLPARERPRILLTARPAAVATAVGLVLAAAVAGVLAIDGRDGPDPGPAGLTGEVSPELAADSPQELSAALTRAFNAYSRADVAGGDEQFQLARRIADTTQVDAATRERMRRRLEEFERVRDLILQRSSVDAAQPVTQSSGIRSPR